MSIQPLSNSLPASERAVPRGRAGQIDAGRQDEAFALPEETAAQAASTPSPAGSAAASEAGEKKAGAAQEAPAEPSGAAVPGKSAGTPQPAAARPDPGLLATLAAAAQGKVVGQGEAAGQGEAEALSVAETSSGEEKPVVTGDAAAASQPVPEIIVAPDIVPAEAATTAAAATAVPALPVPVAPVPVPALALPAAADAVAAPAEDAAGGLAVATDAAGHPPRAQGRSPAHILLDAALAAPASTDATADPTPEQLAQAKPAGEPDGAKTDGAEPPRATPAVMPLASFKALEAMQPAQKPIDLSALTPQVSAWSDPARGLSALDQPAAQQPGAANGQGLAGGQPTPLHVVPIEIGLRALAGARQFDIRLDPGELGRVDVNLSISDEGEINARLVVDRVETLHLLQRDARTLERAFEQAGLKPSDGGVEITLRDTSYQPGFRQNRQQQEAPQRDGVGAGASDGETAAVSTEPASTRRLVRLGGVDLSI